MVGPLPGPCECGSFSALGCPFFFIVRHANVNTGHRLPVLFFPLRILVKRLNKIKVVAILCSVFATDEFL